MSSWSLKTPPELSDEQYSRWQALLETRTGLYFFQHKSILTKGLLQRMRELGSENYEQYFQQVSQVPAGAIEWQRLVDQVSVNETRFFRDPPSYQCVRNYLRQLLEQRSGQDNSSIEIWSLGCSSGEEAYSLAMCANELIEAAPQKFFLGVTASDISASSLVVARRGRYSEKKLAMLPPGLKQKYFSPCGQQQHQLSAELMRRVCFVQSNLLEQSERSSMAMDVLFCQNLLVYFRPQRQQQLLNRLLVHLKPGGLLVLGAGEAAGWRHPQLQSSGDRSVQAFIKTPSD